VGCSVHGEPELRFVSGSRTIDLLAFLVLALLVVSVSYGRLRVYHQVTVWEVSLTRVAPNGERQVLATPEQLRRSSAATEAPAVALASLERGIRNYMRSGQAPQHADPESRFEWRIRYAHNGTDLRQQRSLVFAADGSERRS
jgi:hypothetical protein